MKLTICKNCSALWFLEQLEEELWKVTSYYIHDTMVMKEPDLDQILGYIQSGEIESRWEQMQVRYNYIISAVNPCCADCGGDLEETYILNISPN